MRRGAGRGHVGAIGQRRIEQTMGIVEGRSEDLPAGQVLENRGDASPDIHVGSVERLGRAEARTGGAKGAQQEDRLDQVAARLLDREGSKRTVIERSLAHHAVDRERKLL